MLPFEEKMGVIGHHLACLGCCENTTATFVPGLLLDNCLYKLQNSDSWRAFARNFPLPKRSCPYVSVYCYNNYSHIPLFYLIQKDKLGRPVSNWEFATKVTWSNMNRVHLLILTRI